MREGGGRQTETEITQTDRQTQGDRATETLSKCCCCFFLLFLRLLSSSFLMFENNYKRFTRKQAGARNLITPNDCETR